MLIPNNQEDEQLKPEELQQLDKLLTNARNFHYSSIVLAGISLAISTIDRPVDVALPLGSVIILPRLQATVVIYVLVLTFIVACDRLLSMARPWMKLDPRRPPFAWFVLGTERLDEKALMFWLVFPVMICAIASAGIVQINGQPTQTLVTLLFSGVLVVFTPRVIYTYLDLMQNRRDHRGGRVTYSVYLLYAYRVTRSFFLIAVFITPVFETVPAWEYTVRYIAAFSIFSWIILGLLRLVASFKFIYKRIDRYGTKYGFPAESKHYK